MRPSRAVGFGIPLVAWLFAACLFGGGVFHAVPKARAQASLTAPAGQSRVTAPGGLRGRAARRPKTHRRR